MDDIRETRWDGPNANTGETQTRALVYTNNFTIRGDVSLFAGARLTDYMNISGEFIAITNANVATPAGQAILRASFLNLRREQIVFIVEDSAIESD
ncbi:MAG: hypothetical protein O3C57_00695 [Verrucomicrobia bacterium]|nr:hypothetical protein [Verrucomicrobiota bacterium]